MRFVVIEWDGTDPEAADRRAAVRPIHLEEIARSWIEEHRCGWVDPPRLGRHGGSILIVDFPSREASTDDSPPTPT